MKINVKFFASVAEVTGSDETTIEDFATMKVLQAHLFNTYPALKEMTFVIAHNQEVKQLDFPLSDGDEIAILPPFAGG